MRSAAIIVLLFAATTAFADTYKWEDNSGVHFTDNLSSVPKKYRKRALAEASGDITTRDPDVAKSVQNGNRRRRVIEAQQLAEEESEVRAKAAISAEHAKKRLADEEREKLAASIARKIPVQVQRPSVDHSNVMEDIERWNRDRQLRDIQDKTDSINRRLGGY